MVHMKNSIILSIVIPFKNEIKIMEEAIHRLMEIQNETVEFIFVDDGSQDYSRDFLKVHFSSSVFLRLSGLGAPKAFLEGAKCARGSYVMLLPLDCYLKKNCLKILLLKLQERPEVLIFPKNYIEGPRMEWYSFLQNLFLLRVLKVAAWTNGFVFHTDLTPLLEDVSAGNFLCDLEFSRKLKSSHWQIMPCHIFVSSRRYRKDGVLKRVFINGFILFCWFFKILKTDKLYLIYRGKS